MDHDKTCIYHDICIYGISYMQEGIWERQFKQQYPDGIIMNPGRSGEDRSGDYYQHHPQLFGGNNLQHYPLPQYQYLEQPHVRTWIHQHQQTYPYLRPIISPGFTNLQTPVPDSLEPRNENTSGDGSAASSSASTTKRPRHLCSFGECTNIATSGGVCTRHRTRRKRCEREGCTNKAREGGVCFRHGAKVKKRICRHEGCSNRVVKGGVCKRHGAEKKSCKHEGCTNYARKGGVCIRHGAKVKKKTCSYEGCTKFIFVNGVWTAA